MFHARPRPGTRTAVPFVLVIEGSIPNEKVRATAAARGRLRQRSVDGPAAGSRYGNTWIDQLLPPKGALYAVVAIGTCATYGGIHAMAGNPTGCNMSLADYLGWDFQSAGGLKPIVRTCRAARCSLSNFMETLLWLLQMAAGTAPVIPLDEQHRPT